MVNTEDLDDDSTVVNDSSSITTTPCLLDQCWKTQVCLFSYLSYKVHNNYIIIIGIYTNASEECLFVR